MDINYNKLWKVLIDRNLKKIDLQNQLDISPTTLAKMSHRQFVSMQTICKIANFLDLDIGDIVSIRSSQ